MVQIRLTSNFLIQIYRQNVSFDADNSMWIFHWHERIIMFLSDGGMSEAEDDDESIIPSSTV